MRFRRAPSRATAPRAVNKNDTRSPPRSPPLDELRYSLGDPQHHRSLPPQALEAIQLPLFRNERVHHDVTEVDQDPATRAVAFDADRFAARLDRFFPDGVRDRLHLTLTASGADDKEVGDRRELGHVQVKDVRGLRIDL